jgi:hypothetical protein
MIEEHNDFVEEIFLAVKENVDAVMSQEWERVKRAFVFVRYVDDIDAKGRDEQKQISELLQDYLSRS